MWRLCICLCLFMDGNAIEKIMSGKKDDLAIKLIALATQA